jgi:hypothetical protein
MGFRRHSLLLWWGVAISPGFEPLSRQTDRLETRSYVSVSIFSHLSLKKNETYFSLVEPRVFRFSVLIIRLC